jgi:hypothetical protein
MNPLKMGVWGLAGIVMLLFMAGCRAPSGNDPEPAGTGTTEGGGTRGGAADRGATANMPELKEFPDLIVPQGFKFNPKRSYTSISENYRVAHLVYEGRRDVSEVVNYYRDKMPATGWKLRYIMGMENKTLDFVKEEGLDNRCRVQIIRARKTEVVIDIY